MRNNGLVGHLELLLPAIHVLVSDFNGHWHRLPLDLFTCVSIFNTIFLYWKQCTYYLHVFSTISIRFYIFRSTMQGKTSHKFFDPNENFIMRLYYQKDVLTFMCFCNEMFYSGLYLLNFTTGPTCEFISHVLYNNFKVFCWRLWPRLYTFYCRFLVLSNQLFASKENNMNFTFSFQSLASLCSKF